MKAITIKQPWASLIAHGIKDIENRTWAYPKKYIGQRVLIHTSMKGANFWENEKCYLVDKYLRTINTDEYMKAFGSIIGSVEIVDCVRNHRSEWAEKGAWNWVLANPILFDEPITNVKGRLGLWNYKTNTEK